MLKQQQLLNNFLEEWNQQQGISVRTSGSTGAPKNIILPHAQIVRSALRSNKFFGIQRNSRLHSAISFDYIGGKMMIARSLLAGCTLTFDRPRIDVELKEMDKPVRLLSAVPAQMHYILENPSRFACVEQFLIGGSAISDNIWNSIVNSGLTAWESYGMTETATHIGMRRVLGQADSRPRFVPLRGVTIKSGSDGCMLIQDGDIFVATTDLVKIYPDSSFEILGRKDDIIITGGLKVLPQELEKKLLPFVSPLLTTFYISSIPDEIWSSRLVLVGVPADYKDLSEEEKKNLEQLLRQRMRNIPEDIIPRRLLPKEVKIVEALPTTSSGKLYRKYKFTE